MCPEDYKPWGKQVVFQRGETGNLSLNLFIRIEQEHSDYKKKTP
jgi:hypothetical protein